MSSTSMAESREKPSKGPTQETAEVETVEYPSNSKRIVIMGALYLALFLITLDQNIISTAIPRITDDFHSIADVGWYGSAYLLTTCSFQLLMGKVYKYYPAKPIFLASCVVFEVGSAVCGAAPNSNAFIVGRAIAGLGSSGTFAGMMVIMFCTLPLQQRPIYQGAFGAVFAVSSVIGPLLGGTFTDKLTWRWCFYINLPIGAVAIIIIMFILHLPNQKRDRPAAGWLNKIRQLDPIGTLFFLPGVVCLILALQWGGTKYAWDNARIIVLLVLCGLFVSAFIGIQLWKQEEATVPPRLLKHRSIAASVFFAFFNGAAMMVAMYYLPIWFQAVKGASAVKSGIMLLPMIITTVVGTIGSGILVSKFGYYTPFFVLSSILTPIGAGLFTTFTPSTGHAEWIGYQVLFGLGLGVGAQQALTVAQTVLNRSDIATGSALILFMRFMGPSVFLPVAQNVFLNKLVSKLTNLSGIDASAVIQGGATEIRRLASGSDLTVLLNDYNAALIDALYVVVATSAITILGSVFVEWRNIKSRAQGQGEARKNMNGDEESV